MDKKFKIVIFAFIVVILSAVIVFSVGNNSGAITSSVNSSSGKQGLSLIGSTIVNDNSSFSGISLEELSNHNSETDCWVVYQGKVYDLTSWLPKHPGSAEAIMPYCGNQGFEEAFKKQHGSSKASLFMQVAKLIGDIELKGGI